MRCGNARYEAGPPFAPPQIACLEIAPAGGYLIGQMAAPKAPSSSLTTTELMHFLKVRHKQTIYQLIARGLPVHRKNGSYRFKLEQAIEHLKRPTQKGPINR